jgi:cysteine desulfuration protein SufE
MLQMYMTCLDKQARIKELFALCQSQESKYQKIIEMGREQPHLSIEHKIPPNIVKGCQSTVYLRSYLEDGLVFFETESDALISAGLAALLVRVYSEETPEAILKCPPTYLEALGITASLTPSRANGLHSIHLKMKQEALNWLLT